ncbi:MAG: AmpG family muropeptide MFS transporter [Burkholderiaceae bacterium]
MSDSAASKAAATPHTGWLATLRVYARPATLRMFFLGFSAGLPLLLVLGTLSFWLREAGIDLKTIGFLSWVGLAYGLKWLWAPLVDRLPLPLLTRLLGRRRGWLVATQLALVGAIAAMAFTDPQLDLQRLAWLALLTAFASATQDIALDAYRIESAPVEEQAALAATYQTGYRLAMIWAGAGSLAVAASVATSSTAYEHWPWTVAYLTMAASMSVGLITVLLSPEPQPRTPAETLAREAEFVAKVGACRQRHPALPRLLARFAVWFYDAAVCPFLDFFVRYHWHAVAILALIATYRISDIVMGVMANPFYRDLGFTKEEVAAVSKVYGVAMTLAGAFIGGVVALRIGVLKTLFLGALLSSLTNLLFSALALRGHDLGFLIFTVSADNLAAGLASAAFVAYLSGLTNVAYSATQYALFSSVMLLLPKFLAGFSGLAVEAVGYSNFFIATASLGLPVLVLVLLAARRRP